LPVLKGFPRLTATLYDLDPLGSLAGSGRDPLSWVQEGSRHAGRGDLFNALQCFERSLEIDIDCAEAWMGLAAVFLRMEDTKRAGSCLEVARLLELRRDLPRASA
jgi:Flp pilus assembly protein TadD